MELLFIDGLPPTVGRGGIVRLLIEAGKLNKTHIGKIKLNGGLATIEIADGRASRLAHLLDGHPIETRIFASGSRQEERVSPTLPNYAVGWPWKPKRNNSKPKQMPNPNTLLPASSSAPRM